MNYAEIKNCDIANGPGVRVSLFVSGCTHRCKGCFNEIAWDFGYGKPFTQETVDMLLQMLEPDHIKGITLLGGEPFEPQNQPAIVDFLQQMEVTASYTEDSPAEYPVTLRIRENSAELFHMELTVPSSSMASYMCRVFRREGPAIYADLIKRLTENESEEES